MQISEAKPAISTRAPVEYRGIDYYITACIMRLSGTEWKYSLELHDLKINSVTIADIDKVILKER